MATGTHTLLERITVGAAGAASVTFSSIPQTGYTDLKIVVSARTTSANIADYGIVQFNGDTATNYSYRQLLGDGSAASSTNGTFAGALAFRFSGGGSTSSTFGNGEVYISNYASSNQKSVSSDGVSENNATAANASLWASLWTGTSAITTIKIASGSGNFAQYSTFSLYGIAASGTTPTKAPKAVGGDIIQTDGTYWYHAFINTGAFVPATGLTADVLVVAGGGGGGTTIGGGGGAGGVLLHSSQVFTATNYTVTIGGGGASDTAGTSTQIGVLTAATGGGKGGAASNGGNGGSGGGAGWSNGTTSFSGGTGTSGQGSNGGNNLTDDNTTGGGGGKGAAGANATSGQSGNGGAGTNTYSTWASATSTGVSGYYAGGGGGGARNSFAAAGSGGSGGGGNGSASASTAATNGTANTGSGGGGAGFTNSVGASTVGLGGSGLVIVRYLA